MRLRNADDELSRIATLEQELDIARREIGKLGGELTTRELRIDKRALDKASTHGGTAKRWLGAPVLLEITRRFEGRYPTDRFDPLIERLREIMHDAGDVDLRATSLVWSSSKNRHPIQSHLVVRVAVVEGDYTTLTVTDELGALVGRLFGAFGTILGAGGLIAPIAASIALPVFTPMFLLGWLGGIYGTTRMMFRKLARGRATRLHEVFGALVLEVEPHLRRGLRT